MFICCGRGACGWSFLVGFASGVWGGGGGVFFCVFAGFQSRIRVNSVKYFNSYISQLRRSKHRRHLSESKPNAFFIKGLNKSWVKQT